MKKREQRTQLRKRTRRLVPRVGLVVEEDQVPKGGGSFLAHRGPRVSTLDSVSGERNFEPRACHTWGGRVVGLVGLGLVLVGLAGVVGKRLKYMA